MKIEIYNVIGHKAYSDAPECDGSYAVTCTSKKDALKELKDCINSDIDGWYEECEDGEDEGKPSKMQIMNIVRVCAKGGIGMLNLGGSLDCQYEVKRQTLDISIAVCGNEI